MVVIFKIVAFAPTNGQAPLAYSLPNPPLQLADILILLGQAQIMQSSSRLRKKVTVLRKEVYYLGFILRSFSAV